MAVDADATEHEVTEPVSSQEPDPRSGAGADPDVVAGEREDAADDGADESTAEGAARRTPLKAALGVGLAAFVALAAVAGWIGFRVYQDHRSDQERREFVEIARQGAVNLTTIDYQNADGDVQRILDSATGTFYDDFNNRAQPFIEVVKQAKSESVGTVVDAGLESQTDNEAQVLVAVNVTTTMADGAPQDPRSWRMRISVQKLDDSEFKVSNVSFVP